MELMVEASPRRIFANAHTYHINSISVNSDQETYLSADDLRINLWHLEITDQSFSILFWWTRNRNMEKNYLLLILPVFFSFSKFPFISHRHKSLEFHDFDLNVFPFLLNFSIFFDLAFPASNICYPIWKNFSFF